MNKYTICCSEEQTHKALNLGAPIKKAETRYDLYNERYFFIDDEDKATIIPTAEEMIGWLEEKIYHIVVVKNKNGTWFYMIYCENSLIHEIKSDYTTRKEATLAAIDAALEYLENLNR